MSRPRKHERELRTASVRADLTEAEKAFVQEQAARAELSEAEFLRRRILGRPVLAATTDRRMAPALVAALNRVGVNLNQIAKHLNAGRPERRDLDVALAELRGVLDRLLKDMED